MSTPDITTAQIVGLVVAVIGLAVAFGASVSHAQQAAIVQLITVGVPVFWAADAAIRHGRSQIAAKQLELEAEEHRAGSRSAPPAGPIAGELAPEPAAATASSASAPLPGGA